MAGEDTKKEVSGEIGVGGKNLSFSRPQCPFAKNGQNRFYLTYWHNKISVFIENNLYVSWKWRWHRQMTSFNISLFLT